MKGYSLNKISFSIIFLFFILIYSIGFINDDSLYYIFNIFTDNFNKVMYISIFFIVCFFSFFNFNYLDRVKSTFFIFSMFFVSSLSNNIIFATLVILKVLFFVFIMANMLRYHYLTSVSINNHLKVGFIALSLNYILFSKELYGYESLFVFLVVFFGFYLYYFYFNKISIYDQIRAYDDLVKIFNWFIYILFFKMLFVILIIYDKINNHQENKVLYDILNEVNSLLVFLIKPEDSYNWRFSSFEVRNLYNSFYLFKYVLITMFVSSIFLPFLKELPNFKRKYKLYYYYIKKNFMKSIIISILICDLLTLAIKIIDHANIVIKSPYQCMDVLSSFTDINKFIILDILQLFIGLVFYSKFYYVSNSKNLLLNFEKKIYTFILILSTIIIVWFVYNHYNDYLNRYLLTILYYFFIVYTIFTILFTLKIFFNFEKRNIFLIKSLIISQFLIFLFLLYSDNYELFKRFIIFVIFIDAFILKDELNKTKNFIESKIIFK